MTREFMASGRGPYPVVRRQRPQLLHVHRRQPGSVGYDRPGHQDPGRPLLTLSNDTFRHIHRYIPPYPVLGLREAIETTTPAVRAIQRDWSRQAFSDTFHLMLADFGLIRPACDRRRANCVPTRVTHIGGLEIRRRRCRPAGLFSPPRRCAPSVWRTSGSTHKRQRTLRVERQGRTAEAGSRPPRRFGRQLDPGGPRRRGKRSDEDFPVGSGGWAGRRQHLDEPAADRAVLHGVCRPPRDPGDLVGGLYRGRLEP